MDKYSNIIVLRSVYGANGSKVFIQPCVDPKTGRFPDCVKHVNSMGDMILTDEERNSGKIFIPETETFVIETGKTFNLDDPYERAEWEAIKGCPLIAESRDARDATGRLVIDGDGSEANYRHTENGDRRARYGMAEFYIDRPGEEQDRKITNARLVHNAKGYVFSDTDANRKNMCKILGKNMLYQSDADAMEYLLKIAGTNPNKIIDLYTSSDTGLRLLLVDALDKKVIMYKNDLYMYNNTILGANSDAVITWMKQSKNKQILDLIKNDVLPEALQHSEAVEEKIQAQKAALEEKKAAAEEKKAAQKAEAK